MVNSDYLAGGDTEPMSSCLQVRLETFTVSSAPLCSPHVFDVGCQNSAVANLYARAVLSP